MPKLADKVITGELPIDKFITHNFEGLDKIEDLIHALHSGDCLRGVLKIGAYEVHEKPKIEIISNQKVHGGCIKTLKHWSVVNNCYMTFSIFLPENEVNKQRNEPYPTLYYLAGLTSTHENAPQKSGFAPHAKKHGIAVVFPDTSPRNIEGYTPVDIKDSWLVGYGAGFYCDATAEPWSKNFNMYTYIVEELPRIVEAYFPVKKGVRSIAGHSMGGNGSLMIAARNPGLYKSVSAFAPIANPSNKDSKFAVEAMTRYFADNLEGAKEYDCSIAIRKAAKIPNGLVDFGTHDEYMTSLQPQALIDALGEGGHKNVKFRW